jgi:DNA polymerase III alpha subunit
LIVYDVVEFARRHGILHNLKGSGASSFLAFLLGISHINPIEYDLYFERFLNRGRDDPPDIDLDFDSRKRDQVLSYVLEKYGQGRTGAAFVCSLKNYRARSALYETARAFGLPPQEARSLSKKAPFFAEPDFLKKDNPLPGYREIWKAASEFTSVYCENSLHVGGVLLTPSPASRYLPLEESAKGYIMAHYDRDAVEDLKLIKLDLLSVRGLAAISGQKGLQPVEEGPDHRLLPGGESGDDESPPPYEAGECLRTDPGSGSYPARSDRKRYEGNAPPHPGREARFSRWLPGSNSSRDRGASPLRGTGNADCRTGGRNAS